MLKWLSGILTTVLSGWILHDRLLHRLRSWSWHFLNSDISQGSVVTQLRCGEIITQGFVANSPMNLRICQWKKFENRSTFGEVMDNIVVPCFWLTVVEECKTWVQSEFCCWQNSVRGQEPHKIYIIIVYQPRRGPNILQRFVDLRWAT